ncbi:MAG: nitroreductase family protein [Planctomycetes bacterium]|nr:nitroreductase family protein [Planctomycetota bacterium]
MFDESFSDAWKRRYGTDPTFAPWEVSPFLRHRSVREFARTPIAENTVRALFAAAQSAATSANLQLWSAVSVQEPGRREAIADLCSNQQQIRDCAWFFAFLADHYRLARAARKAGVDPAGLDFLEFYTMSVVDASLAAERMACAAEAAGFGVCYIGALRNDPAGVKTLLRLPEGTFGLFGLCIGVPGGECKAEIKPRLKQEAMWFREAYDVEPDTAEYDARMKAFYVAQGMKGDVTWAMRSGRRADGSEKQMGGRTGQKGWVEGQGFARR